MPEATRISPCWVDLFHLGVGSATWDHWPHVEGKGHPQSIAHMLSPCMQIMSLPYLL